MPDFVASDQGLHVSSGLSTNTHIYEYISETFSCAYHGLKLASVGQSDVYPNGDQVVG